MNKKELSELGEQVKKYHESWVKRGGKITKYYCHHCKNKIATLQPARRQVSSKGFWDSLTTCTNCGKFNFVLVYPSGRTISKCFPPNPRKKEVTMNKGLSDII